MAVRFGGLELATRGDLVAAGAGYVVGFAIDSFFFPGGESSASTAGAFAIGALTAKYAAQTLWERLRSRNTETAIEEQSEQPQTKPQDE
jgi:hypothetical protein